MRFLTHERCPNPIRENSKVSDPTCGAIQRIITARKGRVSPESLKSLLVIKEKTSVLSFAVRNCTDEIVRQMPIHIVGCNGPGRRRSHGDSVRPEHRLPQILLNFPHGSVGLHHWRPPNMLFQRTGYFLGNDAVEQRNPPTCARHQKLIGGSHPVSISNGQHPVPLFARFLRRSGLRRGSCRNQRRSGMPGKETQRRKKPREEPQRSASHAYLLMRQVMEHRKSRVQ